MTDAQRTIENQLIQRLAPYFKLPLRFVEPSSDGDPLGPHIVDADGRTVAMLYWPGHPVEETQAAEQATYALGRIMAEAPGGPDNFDWYERHGP